MIQHAIDINKENMQYLSDVRKHLHKIAEVSENETETAKYLKTELESLNPDVLLDNLGGTGLLAVFDSGNDGPFAIFRAELDALPIQEINDFDYVSKTNGVSHKCGHDGHSATLLGFAQWLSKNKPSRGKVGVLFQPAEENGMGAAAILKDKRWDNYHPDYIIAYHNLPGYELGQVIYKHGSFTTSVKSIIFKITGKTAHAAEPENGYNPAFTIAEILKRGDALSNNDPEKNDFAVVTPVHINLGDLSYGIAAGYGELHLTIRTWSSKEMKKLEEKIIQIAKDACAKDQMKLEIGFTQVFKANQNNDKVVNAVKLAAKQLGLDLHERAYPFKWGEDFGLFTQKYKGAMFGIGAGKDTPSLHNPDYDFPEAVLPIGINMFREIWQKLS